FWYEGLKNQRLAIVPLVWMEVLQGARDKTDQSRIIRFLNRFQIEHPTSEDNLWVMRELAHLRLSYGIHYQDLMVASVAARLAVPLYTFNLKHFSPLPGISVQRPY
ncbi:MAG: hypothetical protein ABI835_06680, partial [Chloroflexota bacterium]